MEPSQERLQQLKEQQHLGNKFYLALASAIRKNHVAGAIHNELGHIKADHNLGHVGLSIAEVDDTPKGGSYHIYVSLLDESTSDQCINQDGKIVHGHAALALEIDTKHTGREITVRAGKSTRTYSITDAERCLRIESEYVRTFSLSH